MLFTLLSSTVPEAPSTLDTALTIGLVVLLVLVVVAAVIRKVLANKKAAADLLEVQAAYPETKKYASIRDIPNFEEFGRMRDLGLSPKQAYAAANPDGTRQAAADATKRQSLENTKNHLKPTVSKSAKDTSVRMPRATLLEWRELFPGYSDKEIAELYKESIK